VKYAAIDFETGETKNKEFVASVNYYKHTFKPWSLAITWRDNDHKMCRAFTTNPREIRDWLTDLSKNNVPVITHNQAFEYGVIINHFPDCQLNWHADTMRLAMQADGGGKYSGKYQTDDEGYRIGLKLEDCSSRFLSQENKEHKSVAHEYLKKHYNIVKNFGRYLHLLPYDILKEYNLGDTDVTLLLYEVLTTILDDRGIDWTHNWPLFDIRCKLTAHSKSNGVAVDMDRLKKEIFRLEQLKESVLEEFREYGGKELIEWEWARAMEWVSSVKSDRGLAKRFESLACDQDKIDDHYRLKLSSTKQLADFLTNVKGIQPVLFTKEKRNRTSTKAFVPQPSFKKEHLGQWGDAGKILQKLGDTNIVIAQACNVYLMAEEYDGRCHFDLRPIGTGSDRMSSKLQD
jgi:hypothetical protein